MVSRSHRRDPRPDLLHDAGAFVAGAKRHGTAGAAGDEVDVTAAEPAGGVLHQHLVRLGLVDVDVHHLIATRTLEKDGGP